LNTGARLLDEGAGPSYLWSSVSPVRINARGLACLERIDSDLLRHLHVLFHMPPPTRGPERALPKAMVSLSRLASSTTRLARPSFSICSAVRISAVK